MPKQLNVTVTNEWLSPELEIYAAVMMLDCGIRFVLS